jgi:hypothetical protein
MINLPNLSLQLPKKPKTEFELEELTESSEAFRKFIKTTETLKYIGDNKIGTFKWQENDSIPDEGKKSKKSIKTE